MTNDAGLKTESASTGNTIFLLIEFQKASLAFQSLMKIQHVHDL